MPGMQLAHAGRKASTAPPFKGGGPVSLADGGWEPIWAPSAIPFREGWQVPRAMSIADIHTVTHAFAAAARGARAAKDRRDSHGARYLLPEFLSPLSNHREREYGGSFKPYPLRARGRDAGRTVWPSGFLYGADLRHRCTEEAGRSGLGGAGRAARRLWRQPHRLLVCGNVAQAKIPLDPVYQDRSPNAIRLETG